MKATWTITTEQLLQSFDKQLAEFLKRDLEVYRSQSSTPHIAVNKAA